jgi:hypothetical protein
LSKQTDSVSGAAGDHLTTSAGNPIADNQNSLAAGPRGPLLLHCSPIAIPRSGVVWPRQWSLILQNDFVSPAQGVGQTVQNIADDSIDALDAGRGQGVCELICNAVRHSPSVPARGSRPLLTTGVRLAR